MDQKKIGKYIADKRKAKGLTQVALAEKLGVSDKSVSKWERGICLPDVSKYQELCETLGISLNELFAGEDLEEATVIQQSEQNIIDVAKLGKIKNKRLSKIIICLLICVTVLAAGLIWLIDKEHLLMGDYITAYASDNPKAAALVSQFGDATLFSYSLTSKYENMKVEIEEYRYGVLTDTTSENIVLPEYRGKKSMFGIKPALNEGEIKIRCAFDGGIAYNRVLVTTEKTDDWAGYAIETIENCKKVVAGEQMPVYAYMTGKDSITVPEGFSYIINNPSESLDSTELCYVVYVTFE